MRRVLTCLLFLMLPLSTPVQAAEYFVSLRGDDAADGTSVSTAFASIQRGVDVLEPGDTLTIQPGEYGGYVRREGLGSDEAETVIRAAIPGTVLLRGDVPAPQFEKVEGERFVYVADIDAPDGVQAVLEQDTLAILEPAPNVAELAFVPGRFHHDREAGRLYISTSDWQPPEAHRYSVAVRAAHGLYLREPRRVVIEGLAVTGFHNLEQLHHREGTLGTTWGMFLFNGKACVIRDCRAYLNAQGIGLSSRSDDSGNNVIARSVTWANGSSTSDATDVGGLTILGARNGRRDVIRDSTSFLNRGFGANIYATSGPAGAEKADRNRLIRNLAWGNGATEFKIKTGYAYAHSIEHSISLGLWHAKDPVHGLIGRMGQAYAEQASADNIILTQEQDLDLDAEFADPANHDYRLQATSRFRNAAPDGGDRGPFPYEANIYYVSSDGDDEADGLSVRRAWKSLDRAMRDLEPGDTLYLQPGRYQTNATVALTGTANESIDIRSRGTEPVVIEGALRLTDSSHVQFERLHFADEVTVADGEAIAFKNCRFTGDETALKATGTSGLDVRHGEFSGFKRCAVALANSEHTYLSGNLYENHESPALRLDTVEALRYADYNAYRRSDVAWQVDGEARDPEDVAQDHEAHIVRLDREPDATLAVRGPLGRAIGNHRDEKQKQKLKLVQTPTVHTLSATTANLEWMASLPARFELAWGETPECENSDTFAADRFASYSLTGLEPGKQYYFRLKAMGIPRDQRNDEIHEANVADLPGRVMTFTTPLKNRPPQTYYVAPDGDDEDTGLNREQAWRTIAHAAAQVNAGDTVRIAGGTYNERVRIRATGAADAPITFAAIPGEKAVLTGADKQLNQGFVAAKKSHLRFDGLYFKDFGSMPLSIRGWYLRLSGEFHLDRGRDIRITRCFSDGRGGYSARFIVARQVEDLLIRNCVTTNKMSGAIALWRCSGLRLEHSVIARPLIQSVYLLNGPDQPSLISRNIFTDMLKKKADLNVALFYVNSFRFQKNNAYHLRSFPPEERALVGDKAYQDLGDAIVDPVFADPHFAGDDSGDEVYGPDTMMDPNRELDFDDFFATNPKLTERGIGLEPEAFEDFRFDAH